MSVSRLAIAAGAAVLSLGQPEARAASNILFILDGSGSMAAKVEGRAKIDVAKEVLGTLIADLPADTRAGLVAYGHTRKDDCKDVQVLTPLGEGGPDAVRKALASVRPKGKTPLADALRDSVKQFPDSGQNNNMVLISDGIDTCGGDPCAVVADLRKQGVDVRVHVVGFDVARNERQQLECIAEKGGGRYFHTASVEGFRQAVAEVTTVAQAEPTPPAIVKIAATPPAKAEAAPSFQDNFDGSELLEHWQVLNAKTDAYIVEDGHLLLLSSVGRLGNDTVKNLMQLQAPLAQGDWEMTASIMFDSLNGTDEFAMGLYKDKDNFLMGGISVVLVVDCGHPGGCFIAQARADFFKKTEGDEKGFVKLFWQEKNGTPDKNDRDFKDRTQELPQPILLRLRKHGHSYTFAAKSNDAKAGSWIELQQLTALRDPGIPTLAFWDTEEGGEGSAEVDWVRIGAVQ